MKTQVKHRRGRYIGLVRVWTASLVILAMAARDVFAYTAVQTTSIAAGAFVGGPLNAPLHINHTPLVSGSPVTKQVIILGEAGDEPPVPPPPYESRLTTDSDFGPLPGRVIRITLRFRFVNAEQVAGNEPPPPYTELPVIEGADPTSFAFAVTPTAFSESILQYRIMAQRLELQNGVQVPIAMVTYPPTSPATPDPWVTVGVQANASEVIGPDGGSIILTDGNPADGETKLSVPAGQFGSPITISINEIPLNSPSIPGGLSNPVSVYEMEVGGNGQSQSQAFTNVLGNSSVRGLFQVSLLYPDFEYPHGQDGLLDGIAVPEQNAAILGWDGFSWRRLGGVSSFKNNTISAKIGFFNFLAVATASPLSPEDRRPLEKVITPNGDGRNDTLLFTFGDLADNIKVEIFDTNGHRVRTLMSQSTLVWDGRNDSSEIVESGVYIYQYKVEGKLVSGLVAVAK